MPVKKEKKLPQKVSKELMKVVSRFDFDKGVKSKSSELKKYNLNFNKKFKSRSDRLKIKEEELTNQTGMSGSSFSSLNSIPLESKDSKVELRTKFQIKDVSQIQEQHL